MAYATQRPPGTGEPSDSELAPTESPGSRPSAGLAFPDGAVVAGRYRVLRFIARGGMGEVYEVLDTTLGERMALKTLRGGTGDPMALERFKRELLLSRRITHPNVCRVFDLGTHQDSGRGGEVLFLTMELLAGESLTESVARNGRMPLAQAGPIAQQLVEALAAAHAAGIVHRDFKSPNVMLVPAPSGPPRAVVTDFGLARSPEAADGTATATGALLGSPAYMAPEQAAGQTAGPAADVYALGVVLFEMVTGRLPFEGGSALEVASRRLHEPAPSPRVHEPGLDPAWEKAILRCLERDPGARFPDVRAVGAALVPGPAGVEPTAVAPPAAAGAGNRRRLAGFGIAAVVALVATLALVGRMLVGGDAAPRGEARPPRLVDLGLRSRLAGEQGQVARAVDLAMHAALEDCTDLTLAGRGRTAQMALDLALPESDRHSPETAQRVARYSGADHLIVGTLSADGDRLALEVALQDTRTGALLTRRVEGRLQDLPSLGAAAAAGVRELLGLPSLPDGKLAGAARAALPSKPAALAPFLDGSERLWRGEYPAAREMLQQAVAEDPSHGPAWVGLTLVACRTWDPALGGEAARKALEIGGIPARDRWWLESQEAAFRGDWPGAIAIQRMAFAERPGLATGLELASALRHAGHPDEIYPVLQVLRALPPPDGDDPSIDDFEYSAATNMHDAERALAAARKGKKTAQERGARSALAEFQRAEALILAGHGEFQAARELAEQSRQTYLALGDAANAAGPLSVLAEAAWSMGEGARAQAYYEEAAELAASSQGEQAAMLLNAAHLALERGALARGERLIADARQKLDPNLIHSQGILGHLDALLKAARGEVAAAREAWAAMPHDATTGTAATGNRAANHGRLLLAAGDLKAARERLERARDVFKGSGFMPEVARCRVYLAQLLLAEGRAAEAASEAQAAAADLQRFAMPGYLADARATESSALLARGDAAGALAAAQAAQALSAQHDLLPVKVQVDAALALASAASGDLAGARTAVARAVELARTTAMPQPTLVARLAAAEVEIAGGRVAEGRKVVAVVAKEAERYGYVPIAARARALAEGRAR
ncbi:MAG TPA: protein kinase [Myxococcales bacterium]|jgi:hypothetical protein